MKHTTVTLDPEKWLSNRPPIIRELFEKFPPGTRFQDGDKILHVVGYSEDGGILVSATDPSVDYKKAVRTTQRICPSCLKK